MKKYIIITFTAAILMSCGGSDKNQSVEELVASGSLEQLRAKKT